MIIHLNISNYLLCYYVVDHNNSYYIVMTLISTCDVIISYKYNIYHLIQYSLGNKMQQQQQELKKQIANIIEKAVNPAYLVQTLVGAAIFIVVFVLVALCMRKILNWFFKTSHLLEQMK